MKNLFLLTLMLASCGTDDDKNGATSSEKPKPRPNLQSIALDAYSDLPSCKAANDKQLAYVRADETFYTCDDKEWTPIEVSPGAKQGLDGKNGSDGADGENFTTNNWFDAVTSKTWLIGASGLYSTAVNTCISPWRVPTKDEALAAAQRGLGLAAVDIGGPTTIWTSDVWDQNATHNFIIQAITTTPATNGANRSTDTRGVFCTED